jgi:hypothetical protein
MNKKIVNLMIKYKNINYISINVKIKLKKDNKDKLIIFNKFIK